MSKEHYCFKLPSLCKPNKKIWYCFHKNNNRKYVCPYCSDAEIQYTLKYSSKNKKAMSEDISKHNLLIAERSFNYKFFCSACMKAYSQNPETFTEEFLFKYNLGLI